LGDRIYSDVWLLGAAWQAGFIPLSGAASRRAIELNGADVGATLRAFETGPLIQSWIAINAEQPSMPETRPEKIDRMCGFLLD
jgi:indolepyruvate ferredoxin oxidoreductase